MSDISLASQIKKTIEERRSHISETLMGGTLSSIEQYKSIQGELTALSLIEESVLEYFKGEN